MAVRGAQAQYRAQFAQPAYSNLIRRAIYCSLLRRSPMPNHFQLSFVSPSTLYLRTLTPNRSLYLKKSPTRSHLTLRMTSPHQLYSATFVIKGRVQGVYYRATAKTVAQRLGLKGYVKNLRDGCVELSAQGSSEKIQEMKEWCAQGPPMASVTDVQEIAPLTTITSTTYTDFAIRH